MVIQAKCPACNQVQNLADSLAGETVECKDCKAPILLPGENARTEDGVSESTSLANDTDHGGGNLFNRAQKRNRDRARQREGMEELPGSARTREDFDGEDKPSNNKRRSGLPEWVWPLVTLAGLVGLGVLGVLVVMSARGAPVTEATYAQIPLGMNAADVKKLMGEPHETSGGDTNNPNRGGIMDTWAWKSGDDKIYVFLMNAKVSAKTGKFGTKTVQESSK